MSMTGERVAEFFRVEAKAIRLCRDWLLPR
jgi:hypothetical protein